MVCVVTRSDSELLSVTHSLGWAMLSVWSLENSQVTLNCKLSTASKTFHEEFSVEEFLLNYSFDSYQKTFCLFKTLSDVKRLIF